MRDHVNESNPTYLFKAAAEMKIPDYVMEEPMMTSADVDDLSPHSFADQPNRLFPIHTKSACLMSALCFYGNRYQNKVIEGQIVKAAGSHGVLGLVREAEAVFTPTLKSASNPEPRFALAIEDDVDGGGTQYFYPIDTESDLTSSARNLTKAAAEERLPISFLRTAAETMVKRAHELKLDPQATLVPEVLALGENRIPDFAKAAALIERRAEFCNVDDAGMQIYRDTIKAAEDAYHKSEDLDDFIQVVSMIDEANHVKYSALIKDPYQVFYCGETQADVEKFANQVVFVGDTAVPAEVVSSLTDDEIEGMFSGITADPVKQARDAAAERTATATQHLAGIGEDNEQALLRLMLQKAA